MRLPGNALCELCAGSVGEPVREVLQQAAGAAVAGHESPVAAQRAGAPRGSPGCGRGGGRARPRPVGVIHAHLGPLNDRIDPRECRDWIAQTMTTTLRDALICGEIEPPRHRSL